MNNQPQIEEQEIVRVVQLLLEGAGVEVSNSTNPFQFWTTKEEFELYLDSIKKIQTSSTYSFTNNIYE